MLDLLMGRIRIQAETGDEHQLELLRHFRDVKDHVIHVVDRVDDLRSSLENALAVNSTIVAERQNDDMKRISAWAALDLRLPGVPVAHGRGVLRPVGGF